MKLTAQYFRQKKIDYGNIVHLVSQCPNVLAEKILKYLKSQGARLDTYDCHQKFPLHYASRVSIELVKLCTLSSIINSQDCDGNTPLHAACTQGDQDIISYLITEMHCDIQIPNKRGKTALHIACSSNKLNVEILTLLLSKTNKVKTDSNKNYPLHLICKYFSDTKLNSFRLLVKYLTTSKQAFTISQANEFNEIPLHFLCSSSIKDAIEAVKVLIPYIKEKINAQTLNGDTPLHLACLGGRHDIVEFLISQDGCDVNIVNEMKETHTSHCL